MITFYDNWYQLTSNELYDRPERGLYDAKTFRLFCLAVRVARLLPDGNTLVFVTEKNGYKLKLSEHTRADQNNIIDAIIPYLNYEPATSDKTTRR